jgi:hypothetical protein
MVANSPLAILCFCQMRYCSWSPMGQVAVLQADSWTPSILPG